MFKKSNNRFWSVIKPKTGFWLGIIAGILITLAVGFFILLGFYLNDSKTDNKPTINNDQAGAVVADAKIRNIQKDEAVRGDKKAAITLIEYSDYQCTYCARVHDNLKQVVEEYGDEVAWVYRHFPLDSIHPYSRKAAEGSECANDQGKFWEYSDEIFADSSILNQGEVGIEQVASNIGLNMNEFNSCLDSGKYTTKVNEDYQEGLANGVTGTPGTFINGQLIKGAVPFETFKQIIDSL